MNHNARPLNEQAINLAGWSTPSSNEMRTLDVKQLLKRREECKERLGNGNGFGLTLGNQMTLFFAKTGRSGVLNPAFVRWLMGFPKEWDEASPGYADWQQAVTAVDE